MLKTYYYILADIVGFCQNRYMHLMLEKEKKKGQQLDSCFLKPPLRTGKKNVMLFVVNEKKNFMLKISTN